MLEKVLDFKEKTSMFLTDTSEDIDAYLRYIASKKTSMIFGSGHPYPRPTIPYEKPKSEDCPEWLSNPWSLRCSSMEAVFSAAGIEKVFFFKIVIMCNMNGTARHWQWDIWADIELARGLLLFTL